MIALLAIPSTESKICVCYSQIYDDAMAAAAVGSAAEHAGKDVFLKVRQSPRAVADPDSASIPNGKAASVSATLSTLPVDAGGVKVSSQPSHQRSHKGSRSQARQRHGAGKVSRLAGTSRPITLDLQC